MPKSLFPTAAVMAVLCLFLSACKPEPVVAKSPLENTIWVAEDLDNKGIIDNSHLTLQLDGQGRVSGHSGCNRYMGQYETADGKLSFPTPLAGTRMACMAEAISNQEQAYLTLLGSIQSYVIDDNGALLLTTDDGRTIRYMAEEAVAEETPAP